MYLPGIYSVKLHITAPSDPVLLPIVIRWGSMYAYIYACMHVRSLRIADRSGIQSSMEANPARGQLNRESSMFLVPVRA